MPLSERRPDHARPCPECESAVQFRNGIETCASCGWFRPQGAD